MQKDGSSNSRAQQPQLSIDLNEIGERNAKLRACYLACCEKSGVKPNGELTATLGINPLLSKNKKKFLSWRLSLCHADLTDVDFEAIITALDSHGYGITELIFNHNEVTDQGVCKQLVPFLSKPSTVIRTLEMFGNKLGDGSCQQFSHVLQTNQSLLRLKLGDNCITTEGSKHLADGLCHNQTLIQLHIGGNGIGDLGVIAIAHALRFNTTLTSLGLRDNDIGVAGLTALTDLLALPHCQLAEVQLKGNRIGLNNACNVLAQALRFNNSLRVLELQSNQISADAVSCLAQALHHNTSIHAINLNDNALMDEGAEHVSHLLQQNHSITTMGLSGNSIAKRGATALWRALQHSNNSLIGIDLGNNNLGNAGAAGLAGVLRVNSTLQSVDLNNNSISSKGMTQLAGALLTNSTLRHLDLGTNHGANEGTIALAKALSHNVSLTRLCLTDNDIHQDGGEALYQYLKNNTTLRNFNYGGQGASANKIHPFTRRQINSIITRNRRAWHTANKAAQEPAEDEEEDDILPELQATGSEVFSELTAPQRSPATPQARRPFQPRTPQHTKGELSRAASTSWEATCTPPSPGPTSLLSHFQSLSYAPPSPAPTPPSATPTLPHPSTVPRGQWPLPSTVSSPPPPMDYLNQMVSATPSPSIYSPASRPHSVVAAYPSPQPHPQRSPGPAPPRQALDTPMAGTELDLLPEPDGRSTPLAFAPAPHRFPTFLAASAAMFPSAQSPLPEMDLCPVDIQRHSFLPNITPSGAHQTPAVFCHSLPPHLLSQVLGQGPAPPAGPPAFAALGQPQLYPAGAKGAAGKGQGFAAPPMRGPRQPAHSAAAPPPPPAARFSHSTHGPGVASPPPASQRPPSGEGPEDRLPVLSRFGVMGRGPQGEAGAGSQPPGKGAGGRKDAANAHPGAPFKPIQTAAGAAPFRPPGGLPVIPPTRGNTTTTSYAAHLTCEPPSCSSPLPPTRLTSPDVPGAPPWRAPAPCSPPPPAPRPSPHDLTPASHSNAARLSLVDWGSVTETVADGCPPDSLPPGQHRSPRALAELLNRVLAATPSNGDCGEDSCDGMPAALLGKGPNPFQTISQQFQGGSHARPATATLAVDEAPDLLDEALRCLTHATADPAPRGRAAGGRKDGLNPSLLPRQADGHGGMAAPAGLRVASAAAAAFSPSAVAALPRDVHGYGGSVFAPRAVDLPALRPNEP